MDKKFTDEEIKEILELVRNDRHTQYIGARYVPIFGRKDGSTIVWDNYHPYEPLTIVLYKGNSYTSRQYVPAGIDITDETYWACTGNYNAQIEQYRTEIEQYRKETETVKTGLEAETTTRETADTALSNRITPLEKTMPSKLSIVSHDDTLEGAGVSSNPLRVKLNRSTTINDTGNTVYPALAKDKTTNAIKGLAFNAGDGLTAYNSDDTNVGPGIRLDKNVLTRINNTESAIAKLTYEGDCLIFGDSIAYGRDSNPLTKRWSTLLCNALHVNEHNFAKDGAWFGTTGESGNTISSQIDTAIADTSINKSAVTLAIVEGGVNNSKERKNAVAVAPEIVNIGNKLQAAYPNARIVYLINLNGGEKQTELIGQHVVWTRTVCRAIIESSKFGVIDATNWLQGTNNYTDTSSNTYIHPSTEGHAYIAGKLLSILKYGINPDDEISSNQWSLDSFVPLTPDTDFNAYIKSHYSGIRIYQNHGMTLLTGFISVDFKDTLTDSQNGTLNTSFSFKIADLPLTVGESYPHYCPAMVAVKKWRDATDAINKEFRHYTGYTTIEETKNNKGHYELRINCENNNSDATKKMGQKGAMAFYVNHIIQTPSF